MKKTTWIVLALGLLCQAVSAQVNTNCEPEPNIITTNALFPGKTIVEWNDRPCDPPTAWFVEGTKDPNATTDPNAIWEMVQPTITRCAWARVDTECCGRMWSSRCSKVVIFPTVGEWEHWRLRGFPQARAAAVAGAPQQTMKESDLTPEQRAELERLFRK